MNNNRSYNKQNYNKRRETVETVRELDSRVAYLYDKARISTSRQQLDRLYKGYLALMKAIRISHYYVIYTNIKNVEGLLRRTGFLGQTTKTGKRH